MHDRFPSTRHSLILAVRQPELRGEALAGIAEIYWKPAYKYIRLRWKKSPEDAHDLTQSFFADALTEGSFLERWDPARASFRTFLRLAIDGFAKNDLTAAARLKRGGGLRSVALGDEFAQAEAELVTAGSSSANPEEIFHREWQRRMFELGLADLRITAKPIPLRVFERHDLDGGVSYAELAEEFGIPVTTVTNHLAWCRRELRRLIELRIAKSASGDEETRREMRTLLQRRKAERA